MRNLNKIYRIRLSDFELEILRTCKERKIKPSEFVREAIRDKAERDLGLKIDIPY
jgi:hypothetical protein